jgi:hypothetical protein
LVGNLPDHILVDQFLIRFVAIDMLKNVASIKILSYNAKGLVKLIVKGVFVGEDIRITDAS